MTAMRPDNEYIFCTSLISALLLLHSWSAFPQSQAISEIKKEYSFEHPKYDSLVVATIGNHHITAQEFLLNYEFGPAFPKREQDSKRRYLNFMIYEKLLALEGYALKLDTLDEVKQTLAELEGDLATEELYKDDVLSRVKVSNKDIEGGIQKERFHLPVKWIFARTKEEIDRQFHLLKNDVSFDSLFRVQLNDTVTIDDRSMESTRLRVELRNPMLAKVLDTLKFGTYSSPIEAPDGYYIVKMVDGRMNPIVTQTEEMKLREDVERALIRYQSDSLSDYYVQKMIVDHHPTIIRKSIDILHTYLAKTILKPEQFSRWGLLQCLEDRWGKADYSDIKSYKNEPLVQFDDGRYTLKDFLNWYRAREYNLKLDPTSPWALFASVQRLVWVMVRDKLLIEHALSRGLNNREKVKKQLQWWKDKVVYQAVKSIIADSIQIDDKTLRNYYAERQREYKDERGTLIPFEQAKDDVTRDYYSYELTKRLVHRILKLKEQYNVAINDEILNNLYVDIENQPRAIDVYAVKKGGTFPRPAFPTIDYAWQSEFLFYSPWLVVLSGE